MHRAPSAKTVHPEVSAQDISLLQQMNQVVHFAPNWQLLRRASAATDFRATFPKDFLKSRTSLTVTLSPQES